MSYEGYEQQLCSKGHYSNVDAMEVSYGDTVAETWKCHCGASLAWWNAVDLTNGSFYTDPVTRKQKRIDGYIELEVAEEATFKECECCGHKKEIEEETYKIPENQGHEV